MQDLLYVISRKIAKVHVKHVDAAVQTDFQTIFQPDTQMSEENDENVEKSLEIPHENVQCPSEWVKTTDHYIRLGDGVSFTKDEMIDFTTDVVCKQEPYLSLPGMVHFYKGRVQYCTKEQAESIIQSLYKTYLSSPTDEIYCTPCLQFYSKGTQDIVIKLQFTPIKSDGQFQIIIDTKDPSSRNTIESYVLAEGTRESLVINDEDLFPSIYDCIQYIPYLFFELENHSNSYATFPRLQVTESTLCINSRSAIIDLEDEVSELEKRLEALRKRKQEIEGASRNVRQNASV
jgi:hypothetical protein